jgi:DNA-directed RNA polymerase subunit RPC12/RpoP
VVAASIPDTNPVQCPGCSRIVPVPSGYDIVICRVCKAQVVGPSSAVKSEKKECGGCGSRRR